uniref:Uncharacterized protein n=1 Tax=Glossina austeni TaxID=7395 RepID=A0A1A9V3D2_GLOAU
MHIRFKSFKLYIHLQSSQSSQQLSAMTIVSTDCDATSKRFALKPLETTLKPVFVRLCDPYSPHKKNVLFVLRKLFFTATFKPVLVIVAITAALTKRTDWLPMETKLWKN